ncbi:uncharacterized protein BDR25DRAFT_161055, partial [Lindgomyces ingoldianus]
ALAALSMIPSCPAPPVVVAFVAELSADIIGGIIVEVACKDKDCGGNNKARSPMRFEPRQITLPPGVSQHAVDECTNSMAGVTITVTQKAANSFQLDAVPAPCMNLATLFTDQGHPVPCGSACMAYDDLTDADSQKLLATIQSL